MTLCEGEIILILVLCFFLKFYICILAELITGFFSPFYITNSLINPGLEYLLFSSSKCLLVSNFFSAKSVVLSNIS